MCKTIEVPVIKRLNLEKAYDLHLSEEQCPSTSVSVDRKYIFSSPLILFPFISASLTFYGTYYTTKPCLPTLSKHTPACIIDMHLEIFGMAMDA